jgi:hypothetical protein
VLFSFISKGLELGASRQRLLRKRAALAGMAASGEKKS